MLKYDYIDQSLLDVSVHIISALEIIQNNPIISISFLIIFCLGIDKLLNPHTREEEMR
jgi:hypothetical protein